MRAPPSLNSNATRWECPGVSSDHNRSPPGEGEGLKPPSVGLSGRPRPNIKQLVPLPNPTAARAHLQIHTSSVPNSPNGNTTITSFPMC